MVKRIYNSLIIFFFVMVFLFYGDSLSIKEFDKITNEYFNATIYLESDVNQEKLINTLKEIADEYNLTIAKVLPDYSGGTNVFVYSKDNKYTYEFLASNGFISGYNNQMTSSSQNAKAYTVQTFYNKAISIKPLNDLENKGVEGKYTLNINDSLTLENLIKDINIKYNDVLTVYPNQRLQNTFLAPVDSLRYHFLIFLIGILFITLLTAFLYDIKSRRKEVAIRRLFGYDTKTIFYDIFKNKVIMPIIFSIIFSEIGVVVFFVFNKNIKNLKILSFFLWGSMKFVVPFVVVLMVVFTLLLLSNITQTSKKVHIVSDIKGRETSGNMLSILVKMGSTLLIIVIFGIVFVSWQFIADKKEAVNRWEETKKYATLNIYKPEYIGADKKREAEFEQAYRTIWSYLNAKDGIMFYKRYSKINQSPINIDNKEVDVPFIYINNNYLRENIILDASGSRIDASYQENSDGIQIFIPMKYKPYENELRQIIHQKHVFDKYIAEDIIKEWITGEKNTVDLSKQKLDDPNITETFIYIKDNQSLFTYTSGEDFIKDGILAVVDEQNMGLNIYMPSLPNMNVKYDNIDMLNNEIRILFSKLGYGAVDTDFNSVYQQNADDVRYFENMMGFSLIVFVLSLMFLILSLLFYIEVYYIKNKKIIAIKNFLGFSFISRNIGVFVSLLIQDIVIIAVGFIIGAFVESKVVGLNILHSILVFSLFVLLFDTLCAVFALKIRENRFMVKTLKGE